jgi:hypothetical protein
VDFLEHTLDTLADNGRTVEEIEWIGTPDFELSWDEFTELIEGEENLDAGYSGLISIPSDLKIVGGNWWLDLETISSIEDDEQIEWAYREKPARPLLSIDKQEREQLHNKIMDSEITDFSIIFGDEPLEYGNVMFIEPNESYSVTRVD